MPKNTPLYHESQVVRIKMMAMEASKLQSKLGLADGKAKDWISAQQATCFETIDGRPGRTSLSHARQLDFPHFMGWFCKLAGREAEALYWEKRCAPILDAPVKEDGTVETREDRRQAMNRVREKCADWGLDFPGYPNGYIDQAGGRLPPMDQMTAKQLVDLASSCDARGRAKRKGDTHWRKLQPEVGRSHAESAESAEGGAHAPRVPEPAPSPATSELDATPWIYL